jgi:hypothetical protein
MRLLTALLVVGSSLVIVSAQPPLMPAPGPEHRALERWVGTWKMEGVLQESPVTPGGTVASTDTCRMFEGGFHLVCDSSGTGPFGPMTGHTILTWDRHAEQYRYVSITNHVDSEIATGTRSGETWTWTSSTKIVDQTIHSRLVVRAVSATEDAMVWEVSTDGQNWSPVMKATSRKVVD